MRLQKYLSELGYCSRSEAESLIKFGRVKVNGKNATLGDKVTGDEEIAVDDKVLSGKKVAQKVLAFYKPADFACSMSRIVGQKSLVDIDFGEDRVFPIGHIDSQSSGLILMTNDGALANELSGVKQEMEYMAALEELDIDYEALALKFTKEFGEESSLKKQGLDILLKCSVGRTRDVRQFFSAFNLLELVRIKIGNVRLLDLEAGQYRLIDNFSVNTL